MHPENHKNFSLNKCQICCNKRKLLRSDGHPPTQRETTVPNFALIKCDTSCKKRSRIAVEEKQKNKFSNNNIEEEQKDRFSNDDIAIEILSRLPIEETRDLKRVSKRWCELLSHPSFISAHFKGPQEGSWGYMYKGHFAVINAAVQISWILKGLITYRLVWGFEDNVWVLKHSKLQREMHHPDLGGNWEQQKQVPRDPDYEHANHIMHPCSLQDEVLFLQIARCMCSYNIRTGEFQQGYCVFSLLSNPTYHIPIVIPHFKSLLQVRPLIMEIEALHQKERLSE